MSATQFFVKKGPFPLMEIIKKIGHHSNMIKNDEVNIQGFEPLNSANVNDLTFLNSIKYKDLSLKTKAVACITTSNLTKFLPKNCIPIETKSVLFAVTQVAKMFYPTADIDKLDENLSKVEDLLNLYPKVKFGKNVLVGKNVKIGINSNISSNTIIESNVCIGENCVIGSFVLIKNSFISNI